jgi:hypothetical protein
VSNDCKCYDCHTAFMVFSLCMPHSKRRDLVSLSDKRRSYTEFRNAFLIHSKIAFKRLATQNAPRCFVHVVMLRTQLTIIAIEDAWT